MRGRHYLVSWMMFRGGLQERGGVAGRGPPLRVPGVRASISHVPLCSGPPLHFK